MTSLIVIILTYPIWIWFVKRWKKNWINKQPARFENINLEEITHDNTSWLKTGISWGAIMFILMTNVNPLIAGKEITLIMILIGIPLWIVAGLGFGYSMKYWMGKHTKPEIN